MECPLLVGFGGRHAFGFDPGFGACERRKLEDPRQITVRTGTEKAEYLSVNQRVLTCHALKSPAALEVKSRDSFPARV